MPFVMPEAAADTLEREYTALPYVGADNVQGTEVEWLALRR
jgi:hypothetical protein